MSNKEQNSILDKVQRQVANIRGKQKINPRLKIRSYKVQPSLATSINSGSLILCIGLIVSMGLITLQVDSTLHLSNFSSDYGKPEITPYENLAILMISFTLGLALSMSFVQILLYFVIGWVLGGFVASLVYGRNGVKGTYYSTIIAISMTMAIALLMGILLMSMSETGYAAGLLIFSMITILIICLAMTVFSIPLIVFAMIGYRIGGYFDNE